jgi:hypothetical protein
MIKSKKILIRITPVEKKILQAVANKRRSTMSQIIRLYINQLKETI